MEQLQQITIIVYLNLLIQEIKDLDIFVNNAIKMIMPFIQVFLKTDGVFSEVDDAPYVPQNCYECHQSKPPITCTCYHLSSFG